MDTFIAIVVCTCLSTVTPDQTVTIGAREHMIFRATDVYFLQVISNKKLGQLSQLPEIQTPSQSAQAGQELPSYQSR